MEIVVSADGWATWKGRSVRCALGRSGIRAEKREGDGATPAGIFPLRRVLWRADRLPRPSTVLPCATIAPDDGWCDDPADPAYNLPVRLPYAGRHESLWREDGLYDLVVVIGHNDDPIVRGAGSAVFLHVAAADGGATAGCVAFSVADLADLLGAADGNDHIRIADSGSSRSS